MPEEKVKETAEGKPERSQKKTKSFLNKVIIRKLPPNLDFETFKNIISPLPDYNDLYFCPADWTLGGEATTRAYIEFRKEEDIFIFKDKFDGYVFVDSVRGSEYQAIVEYASFQGLPKSRARKKDKNVGTIEECDHFNNFLEQLKKEEEDEGVAVKNEVTYSYQMKDDKKITSTPLIEFLAAKNQEKKDAKRKKQDDKRKQRDDEKHKKKIQIARNIPEPIKESKEEVVYADGVRVRTVPSRLGRKKDKDVKTEAKVEKEPDRDSKRGENRSRRKKEKDEKRKYERDQPRGQERDQPRGQERDQQKAQEREQQKPQEREQQKHQEREQQKPKDRDTQRNVTEGQKTKESKEPEETAAKNETKRYSALRKARQEKPTDVKETSESKPEEIVKEKQEKPTQAKSDIKSEEDHAKKEARMKRAQEHRERRAREAAERAQRQIKNKDRPSMQIYQPKRRQDNENKGEGMKSSDEFSENSRRRSETDQKSEKREKRNEKKPSRKSSRDESAKKKTSRKNSDESFTGEFTDIRNEANVEKLKNIKLDEDKKVDAPKAEKVERKKEQEVEKDSEIVDE